MKPISIEFEAFGPYVGHEEVNFELLSSKGLFLICGKTGIGKTMILDAMTFALFGKSSGNGRNDFEAMRCTKAPFEVTTFVKFIFENHGDYYLFERRLERKRKNLSASYNIARKDDNGIWQPMLENPKDKELNQKAVEIIGLEYDQFRQVIVLPQGQFEKLLTSNSDEKEKILTSIFGEEKWKKIADNFYQEVENRKEILKNKKALIERSLEDEGCQTISDLKELIETKEKNLRDKEDEYESHEFDKLISGLHTEQTLVRRFNDLHNAENKLKKLEENASERVRWDKELKDAKRAEAVRELIESRYNAKNALEVRLKQEEKCINAADKAQSNLKDAEENLRLHSEKESEIKNLIEKKAAYENKREDYKGLNAALDNLNKAEKSVKMTKSEEEKAKSALDDLNKEIIKLNSEYEQLKDIHSDLFNRYIAGITGSLAKSLVDGKPCPVCGSTEHPAKAHISDENVSKEEVDLSKDNEDFKYKEINKKTEDQKKADQFYKDKLDDAKNAEQEMASALTVLNGLKERLVSGIDSPESLEKTIADFAKKITDYDSEKIKLTERFNKANEAVSAAEANIKTARNETTDAEGKFSEAESMLLAGLKENDFISSDEVENFMKSQDEMDNLKKSISEYDADIRSARESVSELSAELEGKNEPDSEEVLKNIKNTEAMKTQYMTEMNILSGEIKKLTDKLNKLNNEGEGIEEKIHEAEEDFVFAKKLRGDSGTGLQRYVLGIMFSSVVAAANKMLGLVHGGRYRLFRSDDKSQGTNKKGLELKVFDNNSEEHEGRFVSTLSGGEKFLCSLALSIGMSTVAQKSGIRIEALFIDEGFGSLDEESINDAMSVLNSIQEANGLVGIISHVQILQDQIPSKLRIVEKDGGSHIIQTIG